MLSTTWTPAHYDDVIDSITRRVRAENPELFENFDALKEKPSNPSHSRERIHERVLVGLVADALVTLIGDRDLGNAVSAGRETTSSPIGSSSSPRPMSSANCAPKTSNF